MLAGAHVCLSTHLYCTSQLVKSSPETQHYGIETEWAVETETANFIHGFLDVSCK